MGKQVAEAQVVLTLIDRFTAPFRSLVAKFKAFSSAAGLDRIGRSIGNLGGKIAGLGNALARTSGRLSSFLGLLGVGGGAAIFGAYRLAEAASAIGSEINDTAYKLGIGVEALQEYRYAAKLSGIESVTLSKGIEKLGINAVAAGKGNKGLAKDFKSLGVALKDSAGKMRPLEAILSDTLSRLADMEDPLQRNQLAFKLFGKSGVELVKMLNGGSDALADLRREARATGNVMSARAAAAADEFGDNMDRLQQRLDGLKTFIGIQLLPIFNDALIAIREWYDANQALVRSTITDWVKDLGRFIKDLMNPTSELRQSIKSLADNFAWLIEKIRPVVDFLGGPLQASFIAIGAWILGPLITALAALSLAFVQLGATILATPFGWFLLGVAAIAASVYVLYQRWDDFIAYWENLWPRATAGFKNGFLEGITVALMEFNPLTHIARGMDAVFEYFTGISLLDEGTKLMQTFADGIKSVRDDIVGWFEAKIDEIATAITNKALAFYSAGEKLVTALMDGIKAQWDNLVAWLQGAVNDLLSWLPEGMRDALGLNLNVEPPATPTVPAPAIEPPQPPGTPQDGPTGQRAADSEAASRPASPVRSEAMTRLERILADLGTPSVRVGRPPAISDAASAANPAAETNAALERMLAAMQPPQTPSATPQSVTTQTVEAGTLDAGSVVMPEPIIAHEPQQINAPFSVNLTVNAGATAGEIAAAVNGALAKVAAQQRTSINSSLSD